MVRDENDYSLVEQEGLTISYTGPEWSGEMSDV